MNRIIITIILTITTLAVFGQSSQFVDLKWKIAQDEPLIYSTIMTDDSSTINFSGLWAAKDIDEETKAVFEGVNRAVQDVNLITTLTNKGNGVIDIIMKTKPKEQTMPMDEKFAKAMKGIFTEEQLAEIENDTANKARMADMLKEMQQVLPQEGSVTLRGSVYNTGEIHSFWVQEKQRNLIALFFELPSKPVKIGDKWSLDVNLISTAQNFECDSAYKINEVTLLDIKTVEGETIAVLKYNIEEYVHGIFNIPAFFGNVAEQKETMMKFVHVGTAEFSIDKGRWVNYAGIMSVETTGFMTTNKKTKFALIDEKNN
ncbi:MAG: hypothetical protein LBR55_06020 [Bacteroidales bacterium]|jgi:hypothetical protein|nr:hypothetical protein [Bacteroidales bacterium]